MADDPILTRIKLAPDAQSLSLILRGHLGTSRGTQGLKWVSAPDALLPWASDPRCPLNLLILKAGPQMPSKLRWRWASDGPASCSPRTQGRQKTRSLPDPPGAANGSLDEADKGEHRASKPDRRDQTKATENAKP